MSDYLFMFGFIVILLILVTWTIKTYNKFITLGERVSNAKGQIATQIESRWDAVRNLIEATKTYSKHEAETLENVITQRISIHPNSPIEQIEEYDQQINHVLGRLMAISENYPELKASKVYLKTMDSVDKYENHVRHSRMIYNDVVTRFNRLVRMFPSNIIARLFKFEVKEYFQETENKLNMPSWSGE